MTFAGHGAVSRDICGCHDGGRELLALSGGGNQRCAHPPQCPGRLPDMASLTVRGGNSLPWEHLNPGVPNPGGGRRLGPRPAPTATKADENVPCASRPHLPDSRQREPSPDPEPSLLKRMRDTAPTPLPRAGSPRMPCPLPAATLPDSDALPHLTPHTPPFSPTSASLQVAATCFLPGGYIFAPFHPR